MQRHLYLGWRFLRPGARWGTRCCRDKVLPPKNALASNMVRWSSSSSSSSSDDVTWLCQPSDTIKGFNEASKYGTRMIYAEYTFNSTQPLEEDHFRRAFDRLMRIVPTMRTVLRPKGDAMWYCHLKDTKADLKMLSDKDNLKEEFSRVLDEGFQESDSLPWKVRIAACGPQTPCLVDGLRTKYPYQYDVNFMVNHAVSDGLDMVHVTGYLLQSLDWTLSGKPDTEDKVGTFESNTDFEKLLEQRKKILLQDKSRFDFIKSTLPKIGDEPLIIRAFPSPEVAKPRTESLRRPIDPNLMKKLLAKCSERRISLNSFSIAVFNLALAELMKEMGLIGDCYKIATLIFMSTRRYSSLKTYLLGSHIIGLTYMSEVRSDARNSFWEYCKSVHDELRLYYGKDTLAVDQFIVQGMLEKDLPPFNYTDNPRPLTHDITNAYNADITDLLPVTEHVQLTKLHPRQTIHNFRNGLVQSIFPFRGKINYNFTYASNYFSEKTVNTIADRVMHLCDVVGK